MRMKNNANNTLSNLKNLVSAVDLIGKYVKLTQRGNKNLGLCPFHKEKTPSFTVNDEFYYCFGCHATGDIIKFTQEYHGISFVEAVQKISTDYGIKAYITKNRKLKLETITDFEIGFSIPLKNQLYKYLMDLKYTKQEILQSGIIREHGTSHYDFFEGRVIVPIKDSQGRTIGFGGRIIGKSDAAKYINSAESDFFKKRETLFNFAKAKQAKIKNKNEPIVMTEGYMDVITMSQF
ncbi:MAG: hypothetical protein EBZ58_11715, partial [Bacteroidetes bacterium]|nr:hypothetical protein [Bacteroidota bacterium]